jgi:hypothetical protein
MSGNTVVPVVITYKSGDSDMVSAYEYAERGQLAKIEGWAESFDFEVTDPVFVDLPTKPATDKTVRQIVDMVQRLNCDGIVAASAEYLRVAGLYDSLPDTVWKLSKRVWIADLGSLPIEKRISA